MCKNLNKKLKYARLLTHHNKSLVNECKKSLKTGHFNLNYILKYLDYLRDRAVAESENTAVGATFTPEQHCIWQTAQARDKYVLEKNKYNEFVTNLDKGIFPDTLKDQESLQKYVDELEAAVISSGQQLWYYFIKLMEGDYDTI